MSTTRIVTLFGEEIVPEPQKPAGKGRTGKKDRKEDEDVTEGDDAQTEAGAAMPENAAPIPEAEITPAAAPAPVMMFIGPGGAVPVGHVEDETHAGHHHEDTAPAATTITEQPGTIAPLASPAAEVSADEPAESNEAISATETELSTAGADIATVVPPAPAPLAETPANTQEAGEEPAAIETELEPGETDDEGTDAETGTMAEAAAAPAIIAEDWQGDKNYYAIGEVAALFGVRTSHIRFWTNEFKLKVRTTRKGDRLYTPEQVKELRAIYHLVKERGFTLNGAKTKLKTQKKRDVTTLDLKGSLLALRSKLQILRDQL